MSQESRTAITDYFGAISEMDDEEIWKDMLSVTLTSSERTGSVPGLAEEQFLVVMDITCPSQRCTDGEEEEEEMRKRRRFDIVMCKMLMSRKWKSDKFLSVSSSTKRTCASSRGLTRTSGSSGRGFRYFQSGDRVS